LLSQKIELFKCFEVTSVAKPLYFDMDPNPGFHSDADPDPTFHSESDADLDSGPSVPFQIDPDPDPAFHFDADPEPASQNDAVPCGSRSSTLEVVTILSSSS
jgi:hypothetical protein